MLVILDQHTIWHLLIIRMRMISILFCMQMKS